jgi:glycosyltransferase involved in cell wall biosynthesis
MRILHITNAYKPAFRTGGVVATSFEIAERQVARGHDVIVFTSNNNLDQDLDVPVDQPVAVDGVEVWYFQRKEYLKQYFPFIPYLAQSNGFLYAPAMSRALGQVMPGVDVVHLQAPYTYLNIAAARAARRHRKPVVYQQHGQYDPGRLAYRAWKKRLFINLIEKPVMERADVLLALTESEERSYRDLGLSGLCEIVPNGVDVDRYAQSSDPIQDLDKRITSNHFVILFMSRLHPQKGASRLLDAFLQSHHRLPNPLLVLAGPDEYGLEASFAEKVTQAGASGRVLFAGMVSGAAKTALLRRADLYSLPSDGEGFSMAVLEALAASTPVLISPGCHFDQVEKDKAGLIVDPLPERLADAMLRMSADRDELTAMGKRGRLLVERCYRWDQVVDSLLQTYGRAIERSAFPAKFTQPDRRRHAAENLT